jgi:hypothetical protein
LEIIPAVYNSMDPFSPFRITYNLKLSHSFRVINVFTLPKCHCFINWQTVSDSSRRQSFPLCNFCVLLINVAIATVFFQIHLVVTTQKLIFHLDFIFHVTSIYFTNTVNVIGHWWQPCLWLTYVVFRLWDTHKRILCRTQRVMEPYWCEIIIPLLYLSERDAKVLFRIWLLVKYYWRVLPSDGHLLAASSVNMGQLVLLMIWLVFNLDDKLVCCTYI